PTHALAAPPQPSYYRNVRPEIVERVPAGAEMVLDVGCGAGSLGAHLIATQHARHVVGIEVVPSAAQEAASHLDTVVLANLNITSVDEALARFDKPSFDCIVCADVLEHLVEPWDALSALKAYLKPGGILIVSVPNVRHWSVWGPLLVRGRWDYRDSGIMDRTHLRFFTPRTAQAMCAGAGLDVVSEHALVGGKWRYISAASFGLLRPLLAVQWVFECRKP
ncbi:MAG: hypothetical protein RLZZ598_893, partial [Pseudomonadota bacterium]